MGNGHGAFHTLKREAPRADNPLLSPSRPIGGMEVVYVDEDDAARDVRWRIFRGMNAAIELHEFWKRFSQ